MGKILNWCKEHKTELIIGAVVGIAGGAVCVGIMSSSTPKVTPKITPKVTPKTFGPDVVTRYNDIDEAIFTDLAQEIEKHVMDANNDHRVIIERIYDITEKYFDGAYGGQLIDGELGDLFAHKNVTVTIDTTVGD